MNASNIYDINYFFNSGGKDKQSVLKELYFDIINFLKTVPFRKYLEPNYGTFLHQFENENVNELKMLLLQYSLIIALQNLSNSMPPYKKFVVNPMSVRVFKEKNVLKVAIFVVLEKDFIQSSVSGLLLTDDDVLKIVQNFEV